MPVNMMRYGGALPPLRPHGSAKGSDMAPAANLPLLTATHDPHSPKASA